MAVPVFRAATVKSAATTGTNAPGLPAGLVANDIVFLVATVNTGATISISTAGSLTWTAVSTSPFDVALGEKLYVWWGRYVSGSTGPTLSAASDADHSVAATIAYSGCIDTGSPLDTTGVASNSETTSDTSFSFATGVSSTAHNAMCVCIATSGVDSNTAQVPVMTNAALAALTSRLNFQTANGGGGGFGWTEGTLAAGGSMGTFACTYAGASPKAYVAFALRGGISATTETALIDTIGSSGVRKTLGTSATALTDTITTSSRLGQFAVTASSLTDTVTTSGVRKTFGSSATALTDTVTTSAFRRMFGVSATGLTDSISTSSRLGAFGSSATTLADTFTTSSVLATFGASSAAFADTIGSSGVRTTFSTSTVLSTLSVTSAGTRETFATSDLNITFRVLVEIGGRFGESSLNLTFAPQSEGSRETFGILSSAESFAVGSVGGRTTFSSTATSFAVSTVSSGRVGRYGTIDVPFTFTIGLSGKVPDIGGGSSGAIAASNKVAIVRAETGLMRAEQFPHLTGSKSGNIGRGNG